MIKIIVVIALVAITGVIGFAATRPDHFTVQRSASIEAPAETVFALINDFHRWSSWSPYERMDPAMKRSFGGAPAGEGAVYEWEGNSQVGQGRMTMTATKPPSRITIALDFLRPFEAHNTAEFTLEPRGDRTAVTWAKHGSNPFIAKVMGLFMDMDRMIGKDFEAGLANLKTIAET